MINEIAAFREGTFTYGAYMRTFTSVGTHVILQLVATAESLTTSLNFTYIFPCTLSLLFLSGLHGLSCGAIK